MSTKITLLVANFETQLSTELAVGATTGTLKSVLDKDGNTIPSGNYCMTTESGTSNEEHLIFTLDNTTGNMTGIVSVSRQGVQTSGVKRKHRAGKSIKITDFANLRYIVDILNGASTLDSATPLAYDATPTLSDGKQLATVAYVLSVVSGGTVNFSSQTIADIVGENVVPGSILYYKESDQKWWKAVATDSTTFDQVQLAVSTTTTSANGTATILLSGIASVFSGLTAGSKYYLSNTSGTVSTTPGTTTVFLGVATTTTKIKFYPQTIYWPTQAEKSNLSSLTSLTGHILPSVRKTAPTGYYLCDGSTKSRTTDAALFAAIAPSGTVTITIANPAVFTATAHGLVAGDVVSFTTTGTLPTGGTNNVATNTAYYVISTGLTSNTFQISATRGGSALNTTGGSQAGVHTFYNTNFGHGDGSTTFTLPDLRGYTLVGRNTSDVNFDILNVPNTYVGEKNHTLTTPEIPSHTHGVDGYASGAGAFHISGTVSGSLNGTQQTASAGGGGAHNNMPPYVVINYFIKY